MRILSRAFLASYLALFAVILATSLLAISIIEVMLHFDDISARGEGLGGAFGWLAVRLPSYYLRDVVPLASFAAAFFCLGLAARRLELTAVQAGGIPPLRAALPVLAGAAAVSAGAGILEETVVLQATRVWRGQEASGDLLSRRGSFWYHTGDRIYNVGAADPESRTLHDVEIYEIGPEGRLRRSLRAARVRVEAENRWHLEDATLVHFAPGPARGAPAVERLAETVLEFEREPAPSDPGLLSLRDLRERVERLKREGRPAVRERAVHHGRLAEPATALVFALLAVPLGLAVERTRSLSVCAVRGGVALGAFYAARTLGSLLAMAGAGWAAPFPWALLGAAAALGAFQLSRYRV